MHTPRPIRLPLAWLFLLVGTAVTASAADPGIFSKAAPANAIAGNQISYSVVFNNANSQVANVSDTIPANTRFISLNVSTANWNCSMPAVGATGSISCDRTPGALPEVVVFTITVRVCPETACDVNVTNQARLLAGDPAVQIDSNQVGTLIGTQADLGITKTGPATAAAGTDISYTLSFSNAGPSNSLNSSITDVLPPGWTVVSATPSVGSCGGIGTGTLNCTLGTLGALNQCSTTFPTSGTVTVVAHIPAVAPPGAYTNTATIATGNCLPDPTTGNNTSSVITNVTQTNLGPGQFYPATSVISDTKAGSVLFFNFYTSDPTDPASSNSRISITNTDPTQGVLAHLFFVEGATCSVADRFVCLTPNQTLSFLMSDMDPGTSGYLIAVAVDGPGGFGSGGGTGCPISFNHLIGSASLKLSFSPRREDEVAAESCAAEYGSPVPGCTPNSVTATLNFDGSPTGYNRLPRVLAVDSIASRADGNDTILVVNRIGGDMTRGGAVLGNIFGILYDDAERPHSFNLVSSACQLRGALSNTLPRTTPRFEQVIPSGTTGWMKFWTTTDAAILGIAFNRNDRKTIAANAFEGAHNLHKMTFLPTVSLVVPVIPPSC